MPPGRKYLLVLDGAGHMAFAGTVARAAAKPHITEVTLQASTAFWRATLLGDTNAATLLKSGFKTALAPADRFETK
jgi:hypothetical protein